MNIVVRTAEMRDIDPLWNMCGMAGWKHADNVVSAYVYFTKPYMLTFVAEIDGTVNGFVTFNLSEYWGRRATLVELFASPGVRCAPVVMELMRTAWKTLAANGWEKVLAYVNEGNSHMVRLMDVLGWDRAATIERYSPAGETYLLYTRQVAEGWWLRRRRADGTSKA